MYNIPITRPFLNGSEFSRIKKVLESGWVTQGPVVEEFEQTFANYTGSDHAVAVTSCTTGLHLALLSLNIGPGDEVVVPSFTFIATANAVECTGAKTVLCDIDLTTLNIDILQIEKVITDNTKALIPVHLFGLSADMEPIMTIAEKYDLFVIEDAACGFGAYYKHKHVGNFGNTGCFSFHPRKAITTGEGGMITTNNEELYYKMKAMREHGATVSDIQRHSGNKPYLLPDYPYAGFNYRMTDIQAAIGLAQMDIVEDIQKRRFELADKYDSFIKAIPWLTRPFRNNDFIHGFQSYVCLFQPQEISKDNVPEISTMRNDFMEYLQQNGISTRVGTHAVHILDYYAKKYNHNPGDYVNSWIADRCTIAFPLFTSLTDKEFNYITKIISKYKI
ncbi:MAG: DegT/DnrJ/EryC1/StrS family aminotransferase [Candidatus Scalindua sp.]